MKTFVIIAALVLFLTLSSEFGYAVASGHAIAYALGKCDYHANDPFHYIVFAAQVLRVTNKLAVEGLLTLNQMLGVALLASRHSTMQP